MMTLSYQRKTSCYILECFGNGVAYSLFHRPTGDYVYFQGDAAVNFEQDMGNTENAFPEMDENDLFDWIWSHYGYDDIAVKQLGGEDETKAYARELGLPAGR